MSAQIAERLGAVPHKRGVYILEYNPELHRRKTIRLRGYDYSTNGMYYVTICTQYKADLFGEVINGEMRLNDAGRMVEKWYYELANKFDICLDQYIIMPNNIHLICEIVGADLCVRPESGDKRILEEGGHAGPPLPEIVQWFKTMTANEYIKGVKSGIYPPFNKRIWQRNYYERVIRNEQELYEIREYIQNNPAKWSFGSGLEEMEFDPTLPINAKIRANT